MRLTTHKAYAVAIIAVSLLLMGVRPLIFHTSAAKLPNRSLQLMNPKQGEASDYSFSFDVPSVASVGSIRFQFCSDTPLIDYPCTPPSGFDSSAANLQTQTGETGFTVDANTNANEIFLTRTAANTAPGTSRYVFTGIMNPSAEGTYYVRIQTYASSDGSGASTDDGGLAFVINNSIDISTTVPPYLLFCSGVTIAGYDCSTASGDYINFGELSNAVTKAAKTQMLVATNAGDGYNIWVDGSTLASGTDVIPAISSQDVSRPGTSQFGINLTANTTPAVGETVNGPGSGTVRPAYDTPDRYQFVGGDMLAGATGVNDYRKYTVSYILNINKVQSPGVYISTLTYVCLANF